MELTNDRRTAAEFIADVFGDCNGKATRALQGITEPLIYTLDTAEVNACLKAVSGRYSSYNDYRAEVVAEALTKLSVVLDSNRCALNVRIGRDYSPVIFLEFIADPESGFLSSPEFHEAVCQMEADSLADECFLAYGEVSKGRFWNEVSTLKYRQPCENAEHPTHYVRLWWD